MWSLATNVLQKYGQWLAHVVYMYMCYKVQKLAFVTSASAWLYEAFAENAQNLLIYCSATRTVKV